MDGWPRFAVRFALRASRADTIPAKQSRATIVARQQSVDFQESVTVHAIRIEKGAGKFAALGRPGRGNNIEIDKDADHTALLQLVFGVVLADNVAFRVV